MPPTHAQTQLYSATSTPPQASTEAHIAAALFECAQLASPSQDKRSALLGLPQLVLPLAQAIATGQYRPQAFVMRCGPLSPATRPTPAFTSCCPLSVGAVTRHPHEAAHPEAKPQGCAKVCPDQPSLCPPAPVGQGCGNLLFEKICAARFARQEPNTNSKETQNFKSQISKVKALARNRYPPPTHNTAET